MNIAQRGTSTASITSSGYYTVDRFSFAPISIGTWTMSQDTDVPTGQGFAKSLKLQCTTADAAPASTDFLLLSQALEGQNLQHLKKGTANAESLTVSFWVKAYATGTYVVELADIDNSRSISKSFTIDAAGTWEKKTITYAGDTTGTLDNDNGGSLYLYFWLGAGTDFTSGTLATSWESTTNANRAVGISNLAASTSDYINITGLQLEVNDSASDFEFVPYDMELARCQRYYYKLVSGTQQAFAVGVNVTTALAGAYIKFPTSMRSTPSGDFASGTDYYQFERGGGSDPFNSFIINRANTEGCYIYNGSEISGTAGQAGWMYTKDNSAAYIGFTSEL